MAPNKLNWFMIVWCYSLCINIDDGGWDVLDNVFLGIFPGFVCLLSKIIFKNISLVDIGFDNLILAVQMNSSTLIF